MEKILYSISKLPLKMAVGLLVFANVLMYSCQKDPNYLAPSGNTPNPQLTDRDNPVNLCFLTWNTHILNTPLGLFGGCSGNECEEMAEDIADAVASFDPSGGYDVIGFQEVWQTGAANALKQLMVDQGYIYSRYNHGSGLLTVSKLPIISSTFVEYNAENGILGCANDALKDKGFLYTELKKAEGCYIHFINTHMDAGSCGDDNSARISQINQLNAWINGRYYSHVPHEAFFIVGDFNMHFNSSNEFPVMMDILDDFTPSFTLAGLEGPGYNAVDYILIDRFALVSDVSHQFFDKGPSDHRPVESCMEYQCTSRPPVVIDDEDDPCGTCPPGEFCIGHKCVPL